MKTYLGGIEVTVNLSKEQSVHFPAQCSKCLTWAPDKDFKLGLFTHPPTAYSGTIYSLKAPICSSCKKITKGAKWSLQPIKMISPPPNATLLFENVTYGNMFKEANSSSVVSTYPPFPQPIPDSDAIAGATEPSPSTSYRGSGILGILAGIISFIWFAYWIREIVSLTDTFGPFLVLVLGLLVGGILSIVGGLRAYRGNRKSGGILIILGAILALLNFIGFVPAIIGAILCLKKPMTRGQAYESRLRFGTHVKEATKVCLSCNKKFMWYFARCPYCGVYSPTENKA